MAHFNRGLALMALNRMQEALASYDLAIAQQPAYADAFVNRGLALEALGLLEDALKERGLVDTSLLDTAVPEGALEARIAKERAALVQHVFEGLPGRLASKS